MMRANCEKFDRIFVFQNENCSMVPCYVDAPVSRPFIPQFMVIEEWMIKICNKQIFSCKKGLFNFVVQFSKPLLKIPMKRYAHHYYYNDIK